MKIAVDARELRGRRTGVGRFVHEVLRALAHSGAAAQHHFVLFAPGPIDLTPYQGLHVSSIAVPGHGVGWEQVLLPRLLVRERPHVLFAPGYTAPLLTKVPTVLVIHDVSFSSHPEWFSWREGARRRTLTRLSARHAARVVTVSRFSKAEIEAHLGIAPNRIAVIPNGVTRIDRTGISAEREPIVLYVGSVFNRRNVPALIQAVGLLVARGVAVRLDVVGDNRTTPHVDLVACAAAAGISDRVTIRSYVAEDALAESYAAARAFAFLSDYEGFGLTPLEALSAGLPIVVLDRPTTREVYGDAATYVTEPRPAAIAASLEMALFDETERARVLQASTAVLARYSWAASATQLLNVFDDVAATAGHARR